MVRCVELVDKEGLDVEGIYRLSGKQDDVVELHCKFDQGVCGHACVCVECLCVRGMCSEWMCCVSHMYVWSGVSAEN